MEAAINVEANRIELPNNGIEEKVDQLKQMKIENGHRSNSKKKCFQCALCGKKFKRARCLKIHERIHTGEKPYKCLVCEKSFTQSSTLWEHNKTHTIRDKNFKCIICGINFLTLGVMERHQQIHAGKKRSFESKKVRVVDNQLFK